MSELFLLLIGLACILAFVTVVGHALWLAAAKVMEWLSGGPPNTPPQIPKAPPPARTDPSAIAVYIRRLRERGLIEQATCDTLLDAIQRDQMGVRYKVEGAGVQG